MVMVGCVFSIYIHYSWPVDIMPQIAEAIKADPRVLLDSGEVLLTPGSVNFSHMAAYRVYYIVNLLLIIAGYAMVYIKGKSSEKS